MSTFNAFVLCIIYLLIFRIIFFLYNKRKIIEFTKYQNGPKYFWPLIGNGYVMLNKNIIQCFMELKETYSFPCNLWLGYEYNYITDDPREIKIILNHPKSFDKAKFYDDVVKILLGKTFAMKTSDEIEMWRFQRKLVAKSINPLMFKYFNPIFHKKGCKLIKRLKATQYFSNYQKLLSCVSNASFEIFVESNVCIEIDSNEEDMGFEYYFNQLQVLLAARSFFGRLLPNALWMQFTKEGRNFKYFYDKMRQIFYKVIQKKRKEFSAVDTGFIENRDKLRLLEILLIGEGAKFSDEEIFEQMIFIAFASTESSALTLSNALLLIGMHPDVQENLYQEVVDVVGLKREVFVEDLPKFKYAEQVLLEVLRIYPTVPFLGRYTREDIYLGSKIIPKGCSVIISPYLAHRNEKYWPNPEIFNPDRFSAENMKKIEPGSYIPFLIGLRDCVGKHFAKSLVKVLMINVIRNFRIVLKKQTTEELEFRAYITMRPFAEIDCKFVPRL